jgi:radical SAM protein with 4Fe4S-binding SPASM domain
MTSRSIWGRTNQAVSEGHGTGPRWRQRSLRQGPRERRIGACISCEAWDWCRGGSAAFAWNVAGSFEGEDGFCDAKRSVVRELKSVRTNGVPS